MKTPEWKVLIIEGQGGEDTPIERCLRGSSVPGHGTFSIVFDRVHTFAEAARSLESSTYDAALLHEPFDGGSGRNLLRAASSQGWKTPIILVGSDNAETALDSGAVDWLPEDRLTWDLLSRAIRYAIERRTADTQLAQRLQDVSEIVESIKDSFFALDRDWNFTYINAHAASYGDRDPETLINKNIWEEFPSLVGTELERHYHQVMETRQADHFTWRSGKDRWYDVSIYPTARGISVYWIDKTSQKEAEIEREQLLAELQVTHQEAAQSAEQARSAAEQARIAAEQARYIAREAITAATQLEATLNSLTDGVIVFDRDGVVQRANSFAVALLGFDPLRMHRRLLSRRLELSHKDGTPISYENLPSTRAEKGEFVLNCPMKLHNRRGRTYEVLASALPLYVGKEMLGVVSVWNDITERERMLEQIDADRARLETIMINAPDGFILVDDQSQILYANPAAERLFGAINQSANAPESSTRVEAKLLKLDGMPFGEEQLPLSRAIREGKVLRDIEARVTSPDGTERALLINTAPVFDSEMNANGGIGLYRDVTHIRTLEAEQFHHRTKVAVQRELIEQSERERAQIARDLHDGPLQDLIATNFALVGAMEIDEKTARLQRMHQMQEELQKNIRDLRQFCNDLRPPVLAPFGLEKTIRSHIETFHALHPDIKIRLNLMPDGNAIPEGTRMALFRIYQEAISNIVKHARAKEIRVSLFVDKKHVALEIKDNGEGFTVPTDWIEVARTGHLGLIGMRERVESIGGTMQLWSHPRRGTRIEITVPLQPSA